MTRELYHIYNEMFNNCINIENKVKEILKDKQAKIYNIEVYVGKEETREYQYYIEYRDNSYHNIRGLATEDKLYKIVG